MVFHQCVGIETERKSDLTMRKVGKEPLQVLLIPKYPLPAVPSADHMVESAGKMYPRSTSHTGNISKEDPCVNTELPKPDPTTFFFSVPYDPKKASEVIVLDLSVATPWRGDSVLQYRGCC